VLTFNPRTLAGIEENLRDLAKATGRLAQAEEQIASGRRKIQAVKQLVGNSPPPRVFCMEWVDPVYCGGHWFAEMAELAGGCDRLSRKGVDSIRVPWEELLAWAPEVLVIAPCGFDSANALKQALQLRERPGWNEIPAVKKGRVYAVDANSYFARPGPRVIAGVELLAHLIHPELFRWNGPAEAFVPL
jgi:iron complex transport system substrate-binding protein